MSRPWTFHAAEISYFSAKVRPALRTKRLWFQEVLPDYRGVILPRTGLAFIPVLLTPEDAIWQDTSDILDALEERVPDPPLRPATPFARLAALLVELYADEVALLPAMHYRWSFPESERKARADFAAVAGDPAVAAGFADRMRGALPALGVCAASAAAIEAHTLELLEALEGHFAAHAFLLGGRASLADCALMGPLYAHLYLDAVPGRLLRERAPRTCHWIERMNRPDAARQGDWLDDEALATALHPLLARMGRDGAPLLADAADAIEAWADARADDDAPPPRVVGTHATRFRDARIERATSVYTLWMLQRPLDAFRALAPDERGRALRALAGTGFETLLERAPRHRLVKRDFQLAFA